MLLAAVAFVSIPLGSSFPSSIPVTLGGLPPAHRVRRRRRRLFPGLPTPLSPCGFQCFLGDVFLPRSGPDHKGRQGGDIRISLVLVK